MQAPASNLLLLIKLSPPAHPVSSLSQQTDAGHSGTDSTGQLSPAGGPGGLQGLPEACQD